MPPTNMRNRSGELNWLYPTVNRFMAGGIERNDMPLFLADRQSQKSLVM